MLLPKWRLDGTFPLVSEGMTGRSERTRFAISETHHRKQQRTAVSWVFSMGVMAWDAPYDCVVVNQANSVKVVDWAHWGHDRGRRFLSLLTQRQTFEWQVTELVTGWSLRGASWDRAHLFYEALILERLVDIEVSWTAAFLAADYKPLLRIRSGGGDEIAKTVPTGWDNKEKTYHCESRPSWKEGGSWGWKRDHRSCTKTRLLPLLGW